MWMQGLSFRKILSSFTKLKQTKVCTTGDENKNIIVASALNQNQTESACVCDKIHQVKPPSVLRTACDLLQSCSLWLNTNYQDLRNSDSEYPSWDLFARKQVHSAFTENEAPFKYLSFVTKQQITPIPY